MPKIFSTVSKDTNHVCFSCRAERERARVQQQSTSNKLFTLEGTDESGRPIYSPAPQVQQVCQVVDGFIYVANAKPGRGKIRLPFCFLPFAAAINHFWLRCFASPTSASRFTGEGESEVGHIRAVLSCSGGSASRPLLVMSCISREEPAENRCRTPCVYMARKLGLPELANPWMVTLNIPSHVSFSRAKG